MELTGIGKENAKAFAPLMPGLKCSDYTLCVGAIEDDCAAGVALFNELGDSLMLDYIYVGERFRRKGIATAMIGRTLAELRDTSLVALHVNFPEYAGDLYGLITKLEFKLFRDGKAYRTKMADLLNSATTRRLLGGSVKNKVLRLCDLSPTEKKNFRLALNENDLDPKTISDQSYSRNLSLCTVNQQTGAPAGLVLCRQMHDSVAISYLVNFSKDPAQLLDILKALKRAIEDEGLADCDLIFLTLNDDMVRVPEKLLSSKDLLIQNGEVISGIKMLSEERTIFAPLLKNKGE